MCWSNFSLWLHAPQKFEAKIMILVPPIFIKHIHLRSTSPGAIVVINFVQNLKIGVWWNNMDETGIIMQGKVIQC